MSKVYPVPEHFAENAFINEEKYQRWYKQSLEDPETFWGDRAREFVHWFKPWDRVMNCDISKGHIRWFEGGKTNASYNCLDRHLETRGDQIAIIWEGDDPNADRRITYRQLHAEVCRMANVLKGRGVAKGDRVCIYLPMIIEAAVAMLACARIGAVHSVVFGGFSPDSIKDRILDSDCRTVITADGGFRGGKVVPLRANVDQALKSCPNVSTVLTLRHSGTEVNWVEGRDIWYHEAA
ncbi:MAG TPA: AMP-binding protein, partial [Magnetococcales bacterium]|nr:AMP-binding protein [Magnetococcales bacterium]